MKKIRMQGGVALEGKVRIQGSKNATLPVLAATLLAEGESVIRNCPRIADVHRMVQLLQELGCRVHRRGDGIHVVPGDSPVRTKECTSCQMQGEAITGMRSSLCLLGALLGRCGHVVMEHPGGCVIGARPIDLHIAALEQMGVVFREEAGLLSAGTEALHGAKIHLAFPSVGATENIVLAAVTAEGETVLHGAAKEPEVVALCGFLTACGAQIDGIGTEELRIRGVTALHGAKYRIPADRIVAGTYLFSCIGCGGSVLLVDAPWEQMTSVLETAERMGAQCVTSAEGLFVQSNCTPEAVERLCTGPYPAFPTDLQSVAMAALTCAGGKSVIEETVFENRFRIVEPLCRMGAQIKVTEGRYAQITGVERLRGAAMEACELRGGAALILAGLMAEGESYVTGCHFIERGYENICRDLRELGARIISV